jgi:hypothetical protein
VPYHPAARCPLDATHILWNTAPVQVIGDHADLAVASGEGVRR